MHNRTRWITSPVCLTAFLLFFACSPLHADVGLLLNESMGGGINGWTSAGHAAIYFSRLCAESPLKLRVCRPGEHGSVVSNYNQLGESRNYEWNAVSLDVFLYGVERPEDRSLLAWPAVRQALQERYRRNYMPDLCANSLCLTDPDVNWRDLVASTFARDTYLFLARTTLAQDLAVMQWLNSRPNVNHYSGFTNNCADFAARVLNTYFPGSARADHLNDFTITSPKAIAKSFTHYGKKHQDMDLRVIRFSQQPGSFKPSSDCRKGSEALFRSKRWLFPLLLRPHELAFFIGSYLITGRFNPEHELRRRPAWGPDLRLAQARDAQPLEQSVALQEFRGETVPRRARLRAAVLGTKGAWKAYRDAFRELRDEAEEKGILEHGDSLHQLVDELSKKGRVWMDENGAVWVELADVDDIVREVGLAASNVNDPGSDPRLAYMIMLMRVGDMLHRSSKNRELMPYFEDDWALLLETRERLWPTTQRVSQTNVCCSAPVTASSASSAGSVHGGH